MKTVFILVGICACLSCNKTMQNDRNFINVENFRKPGMDDYETIVAACDSLPENSDIGFDSKTYILSHTPIIQKSFHFHGPATFKRENQITYTLKESANKSSTYLILNSTQGLISKDRFTACLTKDASGATAINVIIRISGDTIILNTPLGKTSGGTSEYPVGTSVFKSIIFFWVLSATKYPDMSCSFDNLIFDGNRDNNTGSYFWNLNAGITALTKGTTYYTNCKFMNSPNETIVGHNADIRNCIFYNLNGSGYHTSADKENCPESEIHSFVINNLFENTNQISNTITGHSEGAITHSNSGGYYTATGNTFKNVGESVIGGLYPSISPHDWGTSNITFTGNTINGAGRMVYLIDTRPSGTIDDVRIEKNTILNLGEVDYSAALSRWPGIILKDKSSE